MCGMCFIFVKWLAVPFQVCTSANPSSGTILFLQHPHNKPVVYTATQLSGL